MIVDLDEYESLITHIRPWSGTAPAGYIPNHFGTMASILFHAHWAPHEMIAEVIRGPRHVTTKRPVFSDGESYFEQCNIVRSVLRARGRFVMVELGGGIGARAVDCAQALRQLNPVEPFLVVVEALPTYYAWCHHHFRVNDLDPQRHWILNGIISDRPIPEIMNLRPWGFGNQLADAAVTELVEQAVREPATAALFGRYLTEAGSVLVQDGAVHADTTRRQVAPPPDLQGLAVEEVLATAVPRHAASQLGFVSALTLENVLAPLERVDFMDVDIQFAEIRVLPPSRELLRRKVKLLSVGTHDANIHETLRQQFEADGWRILAELAPWTEHESRLGKFTTADGILTLENPSLR